MNHISKMNHIHTQVQEDKDRSDNDVHTWPNTYLDRKRPLLELDAAIRERHSTRMFLPQQPVPRALVNEALALAQLAPSNSNIQPWRMVFATGPARARLVEALLEAAHRGHRTSLPCQSPSSTSAANSARKSTGRWESLARIRRAGRLP